MKMKASPLIFMVLIASACTFYSCKSAKEKLAESITVNEQKLFTDSTKVLDAKIAEQVFESYKQYVEKYPDDSASANYLFKAADLANGIRKYKDAVELYSRFREKYPEHKKAAASLFLQAFSYENNFHDKEMAKRLYGEFLKKYPDHQLAPSATVSLEQLNMGMTDEELVKMFEAKQDSLAKAGK